MSAHIFDRHFVLGRLTISITGIARGVTHRYIPSYDFSESSEGTIEANGPVDAFADFNAHKTLLEYVPTPREGFRRTFLSVGTDGNRGVKWTAVDANTHEPTYEDWAADPDRRDGHGQPVRERIENVP